MEIKKINEDDKHFTVNYNLKTGKIIFTDIEADVTCDQLLSLGFGIVDIFLQTVYQTESKIQNPANDTAIDKDLRANLYDRLVLTTNGFANRIYPEHVDLYEKDPEALLKELDKKAKMALTPKQKVDIVKARKAKTTIKFKKPEEVKK